MVLDFATADNAEKPHIQVTRNGDTIAIVPIVGGNVEDAENTVEAIILGLAEMWKVLDPVTPFD